MPDGKEKLKKLHANLVKDGYELPDYATFEKDMADSTKRSKLRTNLVNDGYELPDEKTFTIDMGYGDVEKKSPVASASSGGISTSTSRSFTDEFGFDKYAKPSAPAARQEISRPNFSSRKSNPLKQQEQAPTPVPTPKRKLPLDDHPAFTDDGEGGFSGVLPKEQWDAEHQKRAAAENRGGFIKNAGLKGIGSIIASASDNVMNLITSILPESVVGDTKENAMKQWREEVTPVSREFFKENLGDKTVTKAQEQKYNDEFLTSAAAGLVGSVPAMLSPKGTKVAAMIFQAQDGAMESINNTPQGQALPESTKTIFASGVGIAQGLLEKYGFDKIFGKASTKFSRNLTAKVFNNLVKNSDAPITKEVFEQALNAEMKTAKNQLLGAGNRLSTAAGIEFLTGVGQEAEVVLAEALVNKSTGQNVFEPKSWGEQVGRILKAGGMEAIGGLVLGGVSYSLSGTRNYISDKVASAKTAEDIVALKQEIRDAVAKNGNLTEEHAADLEKIIDDYTRVNSKIPDDVINRKGVADKISEREEVEAQIEAKMAEKDLVDVSLQDDIQKEIDILQGRVAEINNEIGQVKNENPQAVEQAIQEPSAPVVESAVIEIGGKMYEGKNHAEAILKAKADGQDISQVDRQAEGKFKLSDGTIINRAEAKEKFGQDRSELMIEQDEAANQANKDYAKEKKEQQLSDAEIKEIAQQAQNVSATGEDVTIKGFENATRNTLVEKYGQETVDAAIAKYPRESLLNKKPSTTEGKGEGVGSYVGLDFSQRKKEMQSENDKLIKRKRELANDRDDVVTSSGRYSNFSKNERDARLEEIRSEVNDIDDKQVALQKELKVIEAKEKGSVELFDHYSTGHGSTNTIIYDIKNDKLVERENIARGKTKDISIEDAARKNFEKTQRGRNEREINDAYTNDVKKKYEAEIVDKVNNYKQTLPTQSEKTTKNEPTPSKTNQPVQQNESTAQEQGTKEGVPESAEPVGDGGTKKATTLSRNELVNRILSLKVDLGKMGDGGLQSNIAGIPIALWNAAIDTIALAVEGGATLADAISKAIKTHNLSNEKDFNEREFRDRIEAMVNGDDVEAESVSGKKKSFVSRIIEADGTPEASKEGINEHGLKYEPKSQKEAQDLAKSIINELGIDEAVLQAQADKFGGDVNTLVQTEALNKLAEIESSAKTKEEKLDAAKKFAEITVELDRSLREKGRAISAVDFFYKKSPLGIQMAENAKRKADFEGWAKPKEQSWKDAFEEMMKEPEFADVVGAKVKEELKKERAEARQKRIEKVDKVFDKAIKFFKNGGATYSTIIPPKVITTALEGMKKAYHAGEKVGAIIQDAIDYISNELGHASWDKEKFRKEWEEKLKEPSDKKALTDEEVKARYLDRMRKKMAGMTDKQKEEVIIKAHKKIIESGGLEYKDFRDIIAEVTGRGEMTDAEAAKLKSLVEATNAVDAAGKKAREERTQKARAEFREAELRAGAAARELNTLLYNKPNIGNRLNSMLQLNTLGFAALVNNPIYNIWNHVGLRLPVGVVKSGIDKLIQKVSGAMGKEILPETQIFSARVQKEFFQKLGLGTREAVGQFVTGLNRMDYIQKEIHGDQIRPTAAIRDLWDYSKGKKNLTKTQIIDKLLQASPQGVMAEAIARTLNLGDKPMRFASEGAQASAFAKNLGLKGIDYDLFIDFPREEAYMQYKKQGLSDADAAKKADYIKDIIIKEGERSTFQQDNFLNDIVSRIFGGKGSGWGGLTKSLVVSPYIKIPSNAYWSYFNIVNPEVALLQSAIYGAKAYAKSKGTKFSFDKTNSTVEKDLHESKYWAAHAVVGFATRAVIVSLVSAGIFRPSNDEEDTKKEREGEQNYEAQGTVNVSKLWAYMKGEDPSKIKDGITVQNRWFGQFGTVGNTIAKREEEMSKKQKEERDSYVSEMIENIKLSALPELEQGIFGNASSLLTAANMGGSFAQSWGVNTINMMTNIVHPAAFAQISKAQMPYYTKTKADDFKTELKNAMLNRSSSIRKLSDQYPPLKVSIWGEKIPKGESTLMNLFGISRANDDNFAQPIYEDYKRTNDTRFFPPAVMPLINKTKLPSQEANRLAELVGQQRKQLLAPYINNMAAFEGDNILYKNIKDDEDKIKKLQTIYEIGYERGKELFLNENKKYKKVVDKQEEDEKKEDTKNNKKLRKALREK